METKQWTTIDKSDWGDGPWQDEPDKIQWADEATGLPCLAVRSHTGSWCGYAGVLEGHPWYQVDPFDITVSVHGGLNFATHCQENGEESRGICHIPGPGETDKIYWIGFDCGHAWDLKPGSDALLRSIDPTWEERWEAAGRKYGGFAEVYRDLAYVRAQCRDLAAQIRQEANR